MKVMISSTGQDLEAEIDPRFGRCAFFVLVDTESMDFDVFSNESIAMSGGAGIKAAEFVASKGAEAVITGNCGPNAVRVLSAAGLDLFVGQSGSVRNSVEALKRGDLFSTEKANVSDHYGLREANAELSTRNLGPGNSLPWGPGMGKGMGCGRGMGRKIGNQVWAGTGNPEKSGIAEEGEELKAIKKKAEELKMDIEALELRIKTLEKV